MNQQFKPSGYNSVSPYLIVNGAEKMVNLLKQIFGATELRRYDLPNGTIMHIEIQLDDSVIMISDSSEKYPPNQHLIHVYVPNSEETFNKAIEMGCESIDPPKQKGDDTDLRGTFKDFSGNLWSVSTQVE